MNDLSETLGLLLCELTRARMAADMEAVRIAKLYAGDPDGLLRTFPIPRMRMPNVEVTLPVVVSRVPEGYSSQVSPELLVSALSDSLGTALKDLSIHVSTAEIRKIVAEDPYLSQGLVSDALASQLSEKLSDHTRRAAQGGAETKGAAGTAERLKAIAETIRAQVARVLDSLPQRPLGIWVDARTAQVKEVGQGALCLNLKVSVVEDGLEMLFQEPKEGEKTAPGIRRLVQE